MNKLNVLRKLVVNAYKIYIGRIIFDFGYFTFLWKSLDEYKISYKLLERLTYSNEFIMIN